MQENILTYKVISKIGEGGMSSVYLAQHQTLDRKAAIKVLNPELTSKSEIRTRFFNEAVTLSKLNHQNIVTLYDFTEIDGTFYLIMEYVEGASLDNFIHKINKGPIPEGSAIEIFKQILDGFAYAHRKGIVHRDIKPSNIILTPDYTPKILDFGIAKIMQSDNRLTRTGTKMGSILYMSPEQVKGQDVDYRSDIYSLGVTLYEMLAGKIPYENYQSDYEIQNDIVLRALPDITLFNPNVSKNIQSIIAKATAKNPEDRFQSCEEFKSYLKNKNVPETENIHENPFAKTIITSEAENNNKNKKNIIFISSAALIVIIAVILIFVIIGEKDTEKSVNNPQLTENKNLTKSDVTKTSVDETQTIRKLLYDWIDCQNRKDMVIEKYYADNINFYSTGNCTKAYVMGQKRKFFNDYDNVNLNVDNIVIQPGGADEYTCLYDKSYYCTSYSGKINEGKVRSRLVFKKIDGEWKIIRESDDKIYGYYKTK